MGIYLFLSTMSILRGFFPMLFIPFIRSTEWVEHNGLWYYISDGDMVDYAGAIQKCESMNAHLAVITNDDQNVFIKNAAKDNHERWIGMSNKPTNHSNVLCASKTWFWNSDWYCNNDYSPSSLTYHSLLGCFGVTTHSGIWIVKHCLDNTGYVCQWECKIFHFNISYDNGKYSGIYEFYSYVNGHAAYSKRGSTRKIRMYRNLVSSAQEWIINNDDETPKLVARLSSDSYVPYGTALDWTISSQVFISSTFCIECKTLHMCISSAKCYDIYFNATLPVYTNTDGNVFLKQHHKSLSCICFPAIEECGGRLCFPAIEDCGGRCGYIFPYPDFTTRITLDNGENVTFTNLCILPEQQVTETGVANIETSTAALIGTTQVLNRHATTFGFVNTGEPDSELARTAIDFKSVSPVPHLRGKSRILTIVVASVVPVVIIILIIVVVVIIIYRRKRNRNKKSIPDLQSTGKLNLAASNRNNTEYLEFDDSIPAQPQEPAYVEILANAHADSIGHTNVDRVHRIYSGVKVDAGNENQKPIAGYLAPNYGILMDNLNKENGWQPKQQTHNIPVYTEVKKTTSKKEDSKNNDTCEQELQIRENEINDSGNEHVFDSSKTSQGKNNNLSDHCDYYDIQRLDNDGDDNVELFENTVYDQT